MIFPELCWFCIGPLLEDWRLLIAIDDDDWDESMLRDLRDIIGKVASVPTMLSVLDFVALEFVSVSCIKEIKNFNF